MRKDVSMIEESFPELAKDFSLPAWLPHDIVQDNVFSTALRLSSPHIQLWTHYDVMDNVLCNVVGRKRVILWAPEEVDNLYVTGSTSAVTNMDSPNLDKYPRFALAKKVECILEPGDMLFIPGKRREGRRRRRRRKEKRRRRRRRRRRR